MPAFESNDGKYLQDSNAIAYYVANEQLRGKTDYEKAQILQWVGFGESEILPAGCAWVFPILGVIKKNPAAEEVGEVSSIFTSFKGRLINHLLVNL